MANEINQGQKVEIPPGLDPLCNFKSDVKMALRLLFILPGCMIVSGLCLYGAELAKLAAAHLGR
jgi:hypothetical protein